MSDRELRKALDAIGSARDDKARRGRHLAMSVAGAVLVALVAVGLFVGVALTGGSTFGLLLGGGFVTIFGGGFSAAMIGAAAEENTKAAKELKRAERRHRDLVMES